uniref:glutathione transferase n=1 Tax=Cordyceps militaris TaxID=73501 RepID=J3SIN9_CORMI|nr:glutathione S-transferase [Cordyceps militaris]
MASIEDRPASIPDADLVLYVVKGMLNRLPYEQQKLWHIHVIGSTKNETWFHDVSPHKMVPAMESVEYRGGKRLNIWDSTSCLLYISDVHDSTGAWKGRDVWERAQRQLKHPEQSYVALPDRPSIADIAILPFVTEELASKAGLDLSQWPHLLQWSRRMMDRPAFKDAMVEVETYGHDI